MRCLRDFSALMLGATLASCALIDGLADDEPFERVGDAGVEPPDGGVEQPDGGFSTAPLTITGIALAESQVSVVVGSASFDGAADGTGRFSVVIPAGTPSAVVVLRARGSASRNQARIELASALDAIEALRGLAGDDDILTENEHPGTRVTALTTARYAALTEVNGGVHPVGRPQLISADRRAGESLSANFVEVAAVLRAFINEPQRALPDGFSTTLEWAVDPIAVRTYVDGLLETDDLTRLLENLPLSSGALTARFDVPAPSSYYGGFAAKRNGVAGFVLTRWSFDAGQVGTHQYSFSLSTQAPPPEVSFTWQANDVGVAVDYDVSPFESFPIVGADQVVELLGNPPMETEIRDAVSSGLVRQVRQTITRSQLLRVPGGVGVDWVVQINTAKYHFSEAFAAAGLTVRDVEVIEPPFGTRWVRSSDLSFVPFAGSMVRDQTWVLRILGPTPVAHFLGDFDVGAPLLSAAFVTFNDDADRTATVQYGLAEAPITMNWTLQDGQVELTYPNGTRQRFALYERVQREWGVWTWIDEASTSYFDYFRAAQADPGFALAPRQLQTPAGRYWQNTINQATLLPVAGEVIARSSVFGFEFAADGTVRRLSRLDEQGAPVFEDFWRWTLEAGVVDIAGFEDALGGLQRCDTTQASCVQWRERLWRPVKLEDGWLYVVERTRWRPVDTQWDDTMQTWLNGDGTPFDSPDDLLYLVPPRLNAYYLFDTP